MKNKLQIALRGFRNERLFTSLNLLSLTIGLVVAYTAIGYLRFEWSYDRFHKNADSVFRLVRTYRSQDYSVVGFSNWDSALNTEQQRQLESIKNTPGVTDAAQFITSPGSVFVEANGRKIGEKDLLTTNTPRAFCSLFTWSLRQGSFADFGQGTNKVILTATTAQKIFGPDALTNPDLIQKPVKIGADFFTLAAIIDDVPPNSHVQFTMVLSRPRIPYWGSRVYVQTEQGTVSERVAGQINASIARFNPKLAADPLYKKHYLQPITDIHLRSAILYELKTPGNPLYLLLIGGFAVFIVIITLVNYANLSLAIQSKRSRSIGVRKVLGASGWGVASQFILEGVLLALVAVPLAILLIATGMPAFNTLMGVAIPVNVLSEPIALLTLLLLAVLLGGLSSSFAAIHLAWKHSLALFKNNLRGQATQTVSTRKYLVVSQFVVLITITSVSYFITQQLDFIQNKELGYQKEGILYVYSSPEKQTRFQEQLRQVSGVKSVGNGSSFGIMPFNQGTYKLQGTEQVYDDARQLYLDPEALQAYGLKTSFGKTLTPQNRPATYTIINRTAAEKLAVQQQVPVESLIGKTIITEPEYVDENNRAGFPFTVAGIFEDINVFSLHEKVEPYFITVARDLRMDGRTIVRYDPATTAQTLASIGALYARLGEPAPLEIDYLDAQLAALYQQDNQTATLLFSFNLIALLLAGLGLAGITIFLTVARTKEIGIRKVLGASSLSIIRSTTGEYVVLIGLGLVVSWPLAWYLADKWLNNFAYHVPIQQGVFVGVGALVLLFTTLIVGVIAYKASLKNPVSSLRSE